MCGVYFSKSFGILKSKRVPQSAAASSSAVTLGLLHKEVHLSSLWCVCVNYLPAEGTLLRAVRYERDCVEYCVVAVVLWRQTKLDLVAVLPLSAVVLL